MIDRRYLLMFVSEDRQKLDRCDQITERQRPWSLRQIVSPGNDSWWISWPFRHGQISLTGIVVDKSHCLFNPSFRRLIRSWTGAPFKTKLIVPPGFEEQGLEYIHDINVRNVLFASWGIVSVGVAFLYAGTSFVCVDFQVLTIVTDAVKIEGNKASIKISMLFKIIHQ